MPVVRRLLLYVHLYCHAGVLNAISASFVWVTTALHSRVQVGPSAWLRHGVFIILFNRCSIMWVRASVYFAQWCLNLCLLYIHEHMHRIKKFISAYHVPRRISCMYSVHNVLTFALSGVAPLHNVQCLQNSSYWIITNLISDDICVHQIHASAFQVVWLIEFSLFVFGPASIQVYMFVKMFGVAHAHTNSQ